SALWSFFSLASFGFFVAHTVMHPRQVVFKKNQVDDILVYIDLGLNIYFVIFFIIRFIGTNDKRSFIVSSSTWMEVLTIGPALAAIVGEQKQLMFSFLRAFAPQTASKTFCSLLGSTFFASIIPDIYAVLLARVRAKLRQSRSFYTGASEGHIIYCGSSQLNKLKSFFWNFYHNISLSTDGIIRQPGLRADHVVPALILRSHHGGVRQPSDAEFLIQGCKLNSAEAIILTSEAGSAHSDFEADRINYQSFRALPLWRTKQGKPGSLPPDAVLCDNQVLLGLMGINSVAPGLATLLINLLSYRESRAQKKTNSMQLPAATPVTAGAAPPRVTSWTTRAPGAARVQEHQLAHRLQRWHPGENLLRRLHGEAPGPQLQEARAGGLPGKPLAALETYSILLMGVCMVDKLTAC
uniref:BK_channel_a domain-containing protein n=1 Tax=Macrostomum lignano TaxID=282301 RepID=A0A1I8JP21_9PLAT